MSGSSIDQFFSYIERFPVLDHKEHIELAEIIQEWQQHPEGSHAAPKTIRIRGMWARDKMVRHNLRLVVFIWRENYLPRIPYESAGLMDAFQCANLGLIRAAEKYQPSKAKFSTYAATWIHKGLREFLNTDRFVRIPFNNVAVLKAAQAFQADAERRGEDHPSCEEILERIKKQRKNLPTADHLRLMLRQAHITNVCSMDARTVQRRSDTPAQRIADRAFFLAADDPDEDLNTLHEILPRLSDTERLIVDRRFLAEKPATLQQLARELRVNRSTAARLEQGVLETLRSLCA